MKFKELNIKELASAEKEVISQKEYVKEHIFVGLQRSGDEEIEKQNTEFEGIEKYLYIRMKKDDDVFAMKVDHNYLEKMGVSVQEVWRMAEKNTNEESFVMELLEHLCRMFGEYVKNIFLPDEILPYYVVTNKSGCRGASAILNKKMLSEFGERYNIDKIVVIPSSIHEMLILPADIIDFDLIGMDKITEMVQTVNANTVLSKEQLSDRAYILRI